MGPWYSATHVPICNYIKYIFNAQSHYSSHFLWINVMGGHLTRVAGYDLDWHDCGRGAVRPELKVKSPSLKVKWSKITFKSMDRIYSKSNHLSDVWSIKINVFMITVMLTWYAYIVSQANLVHHPKFAQYHFNRKGKQQAVFFCYLNGVPALLSSSKR